jgi:hypothetical protein
MTDSDLNDFALVVRGFAKHSIVAKRKLSDIEAELEWRRAAHSEKNPRP